ncbi:hypothetical protein AMS68_001861 [Peltaster fructicola]|uniref:Ubiquinone biosynthesis monooxygenase COQ6, mitochondrial n=1 Tax=Peltaster fructicola TaxID=286661 RepID=A0A6H0XNP5_9PEZI|nr:hypothetical protein AMS68_001861 [Peltaster fructicola]
MNSYHAMGRRLTARRLLSLPVELRRSIATSTTSSPEIFDIVCIGGGPAGLSLLAALQSSSATRDLKIALIDSQKLSASTTGTPDVYSNRCSSLTPASVSFLRRIGVWDHVHTNRTQEYQRMHVWDGVSGTKISFDPEDRRSGILNSITSVIPGTRWASQQGDDTIATMCENTNLTTALLRQLQTMSNVEIFDSTKVSAIALGPEPVDEKSLDLSQWPVVSLSNRNLAARLLIGADGANSPVRQFADIPAHGWDYNAQGVVATLSVDRSSEYIGQYTAYQRFLPTGPIALLPLPDNKVSLVWSTTPQLAAKLKSLSSEDFIAMVNGAFRLLSTDLAYIHTLSSAQAEEVAWREGQTDSAALGLPATIPRVTAVQQGSIASFPLRMRHADLYTGHRVALIGDAAHTIHPLAGQGLNLGLADAEALAGRIVEGIETGMDIGSCWCLDDYNSDRWAANNAVMGVCDKLNKLYSTDSAPVVAARSLGLGLVDRLGPLKGMIMGAAAGAR